MIAKGECCNVCHKLAIDKTHAVDWSPTFQCLQYPWFLNDSSAFVSYRTIPRKTCLLCEVPRVKTIAPLITDYLFHLVSLSFWCEHHKTTGLSSQ